MTFAFTFGVGSPLAKYYVEISAPDETTARCLMICMFSSHWAGIYPREGFDRQIQQFNLKPLDVNFNAGVRLGTNHAEIPRDVYNRAYGVAPQ